MPLVGYHLVGFDQGPLSFEEIDLALIASERSRERTYEFFSRCPHKFNLIFHNGDWRPEWPELYKKYRNPINANAHWLLSGRIGNEFRWKQRNKVDHEIREQLLAGCPWYDDAINVIYTTNATGTAFPIPMTPWIMAHRMAHIQMLATEDISILVRQLDWGYQKLKGVYDYKMKPKPNVFEWNERLRPCVKGGANLQSPDARVFHGLFINMSTTRACRTGQLLPWFDYFPEWFAQYIRFGAIRFTPILPERLDLHKLFDDPNRQIVPFPDREIVANREVSTDPFANEMGQKFEGILRLWAGEVIVT